MSSRVKNSSMMMEPDPERIGAATLAYRKDKMYRKKKRGNFPCRHKLLEGDLCSQHHFNRSSAANKHMHKDHDIPYGSDLMYASVSKKKVGNGTFVCKFVADNGTSCTKSYVYPGTANKHMMQKHGVGEDSELLHSIPSKPYKKRTVEKNSNKKTGAKVMKSPDGESQSESDSSTDEYNSDEEDEDGQEHENQQKQEENGQEHENEQKQEENGPTIKQAKRKKAADKKKAGDKMNAVFTDVAVLCGASEQPGAKETDLEL